MSLDRNIISLLVIMNTKADCSVHPGSGVGIAAMGVALFWSAGRMDWWPAWAAIVVWSGLFYGDGYRAPPALTRN